MQKKKIKPSYQIAQSIKFPVYYDWVHHRHAAITIFTNLRRQMASLAVVTQDKVRLPVARAIDNATKFMLLSISSRPVFFFFLLSDQIHNQDKTLLRPKFKHLSWHVYR